MLPKAGQPPGSTNSYRNPKHPFTISSLSCLLHWAELSTTDTDASNYQKNEQCLKQQEQSFQTTETPQNQPSPQTPPNPNQRNP